MLNIISEGQIPSNSNNISNYLSTTQNRLNTKNLIVDRQFVDSLNDIKQDQNINNDYFKNPIEVKLGNNIGGVIL